MKVVIIDDDPENLISLSEASVRALADISCPDDVVCIHPSPKEIAKPRSMKAAVRWRSSRTAGDVATLLTELCTGAAAIVFYDLKLLGIQDSTPSAVASEITKELVRLLADADNRLLLRIHSGDQASGVVAAEILAGAGGIDVVGDRSRDTQSVSQFRVKRGGAQIIYESIAVEAVQAWQRIFGGAEDRLWPSYTSGWFGQNHPDVPHRWATVAQSTASRERWRRAVDRYLADVCPKAPNWTTCRDCSQEMVHNELKHLVGAYARHARLGALNVSQSGATAGSQKARDKKREGRRTSGKSSVRVDRIGAEPVERDKNLSLGAIVWLLATVSRADSDWLRTFHWSHRLQHEVLPAQRPDVGRKVIAGLVLAFGELEGAVEEVSLGDTSLEMVLGFDCRKSPTRPDQPLLKKLLEINTEGGTVWNGLRTFLALGALEERGNREARSVVNLSWDGTRSRLLFVPTVR
jgi:hypothetical protein